MKADEELINRYIDGELTGEELKNFLEELDNSPQLKSEVQLLRAASAGLKNNITEFSTSIDFTQKLMLQINKKFKPRKSDKFFILSVSSFFVLISLALTGYIVAGMIGSTEGSSSITLGESIFSMLENFTVAIISMFSSSSISLIGGIISFGLIISGFFYFDYLKSTR